MGSKGRGPRTQNTGEQRAVKARVTCARRPCAWGGEGASVTGIPLPVDRAFDFASAFGMLTVQRPMPPIHASGAPALCMAPDACMAHMAHTKALHLTSLALPRTGGGIGGGAG
jgi:hypothetical protein